MKRNPVAFISHASEDKERFVVKFAERLRTIGVDAWLDQWEMLPGDSLVDKIFEEGIKNGDFFIVVLSANSVNKPWVREELNAAMVKRISKQVKIIPVVLDGVPVPECLKSTLYESISDLNDYDKSFSRIKNSIFEVKEKPPLGELPRYLTSNSFSLPSLTKVDSIVLLEACNLALEKGELGQSEQEMMKRVSGQGIDESELYESLDILSRKGYLDSRKTLDGLIHFYNVKYIAIYKYSVGNNKDFGEIERRIAVSIVAGVGNRQIATDLKVPLIVVNSVFDQLRLRGLIRYSVMLSGDLIIHDVSPELRRMLHR